PTPTKPPTVFGDMDCDHSVGSNDALELLRLVASIGSPTSCSQSTDVNCDGATNAVDALEILLYVVSAPYTVSAGCPPIGK
ncbi:MAG TPA: dockerin type I domain-containing protein, partial [Dehalococcoidia bacterium]|nr:dockerin type I domain-containing protein [Dehalococcoidia bacterium]